MYDNLLDLIAVIRFYKTLTLGKLVEGYTKIPCTICVIPLKLKLFQNKKLKNPITKKATLGKQEERVLPQPD